MPLAVPRYLAESGVAGPGAGSAGLPIGTVWAAVVTPERELQRELHLPGNRAEVMEGIVERVLEMLEGGPDALPVRLRTREKET